MKDKKSVAKFLVLLIDVAAFYAGTQVGRYLESADMLKGVVFRSAGGG